MPPPEFRMAIVADVAVALPSQFPTVVLRETEAPRRQLSFSVGMQDGVGLSHALRRIPTPRPLTHELITDVLGGFDIDVVAIRLVGRQGKTYFAELDLRGRTGRNVYSCRPTDALAIALRQAVPVPILIDSRLFESEGDVAPWSPPPTPTASAPPEPEVHSEPTEPEVHAEPTKTEVHAEPTKTEGNEGAKGLAEPEGRAEPEATPNDEGAEVPTPIGARGGEGEAGT